VVSNVIKRCSICGRFFGEDGFPWQNKKKDYKKPYCKRCNSNRSYLWRLDNKEHCQEYKKQWYKDNKEYKKGRNKQHYQDNKEQILERNKQYHKDNKEHRNERSKQWQIDNPDKVNAHAAKRRVAKKNQTILLTDIEKDRYNFIYEVASTMADHCVDHWQPVNRDGSDHPDNLQILTHALNAEKSDKWPLTPEEEIRYKGFRL